MTPLRSTYLLAIKSAVQAEPLIDGFWEEESAPSLDDELFEIGQQLSAKELALYHVLTIWGDRTARYVVRERVQKRLHHVLLRTGDFSLLVAPGIVLDAFVWSGRQLLRLGSPPGQGGADADVLRSISQRWQTLSASELH